MSKQNNQEPTAAELEILAILWEAQPLSVREIHEKLSKKEVGYTTTLKIMQNMTAKGLLERELVGKSHYYTAVYEKESTRHRYGNNNASAHHLADGTPVSGNHPFDTGVHPGLRVFTTLGPFNATRDCCTVSA